MLVVLWGKWNFTEFSFDPNTRLIRLTSDHMKVPGPRETHRQREIQVFIRDDSIIRYFIRKSYGSKRWIVFLEGKIDYFIKVKVMSRAMIFFTWINQKFDKIWPIFTWKPNLRQKLTSKIKILTFEHQNVDKKLTFWNFDLKKPKFGQLLIFKYQKFVLFWP